MPPIDLEAVERDLARLETFEGLELALRALDFAKSYGSDLAARVRELEGINADLLRDNTELAHEVKARDPRCEAHPYEADDAGCAPCHLIRVRELEAALAPFAAVAGYELEHRTGSQVAMQSHRVLPAGSFEQARTALDG